MRLFVLFLLALAAPLAHAGARDQLDAFGAGMTGMAADFEQRVHAPDGELLESSSGTLKLRAPREFRWEVVQPFPQVIVADGTHVWIHDPDLEQVTVRIQSLEEQGSPLSVLVDPSELDRQFEVVEGVQSDGMSWLALTPRKPEESPFESARLGFDANGLVVMEMSDGLGQRTEVRFSGWQRNPDFDAGTFAFTPPPGTEVVGEMAQAAEVMPLAD
ncbi:outer-membrane lipoprotein carrier protein [Arenimonas soli]|uniref:Outer-membrane lipoprotein carrier protein n=1 Tax=Arenimonas soli TaxID=2269504 RepID=A0ABQ1HFP9_9GAMM|nr:outer membrane lipoprotein chaperone LolA [Arenimonas soli]GGA75662.1 outer-membrane lipoprotein carrier protein [Arenimonas soli]